MKTFLIILSIIGLGLTIIPSILVFNGAISLYMHKVLMFIGTVLWFASAPFWMGKNDEEKVATDS